MLKQRRRLSLQELKLGILLTNELLFMQHFWAHELTVPEDRTDLPVTWRGRQVISERQRLMALDRNPKVQYCTGRKLAKTINVEARLVFWPLTARPKGRTEALFFTPNEHHLSPIIDRIESKLQTVPLFRAMLMDFNRSENILTFNQGNGNTFVWYLRIEGQSHTGRSMVGPRCSFMLGDEGAYGNWAAFKERLNTALPGSRWLWAGVPNGNRNTPFWAVDQTRQYGGDWSRHNYPTFINPVYFSQSARAEEIQKHGGLHSQSYITQVLGQWGDEAVSSFPVIGVADIPFIHISLTGEQVQMHLNNLQLYLNLPVDEVRKRARRWLIGGDIGYSPDPTVLLVFYETDRGWEELARLDLYRVRLPYQARLVHTLNAFVLPEPAVIIVLEAHGSGAGILDDLKSAPEYREFAYETFAVDAGFAGTVNDARIKLHRVCRTAVRRVQDVYICDTCHVPVAEENLREATVQAKQYYTEMLKESLAAGQAVLDGTRTALSNPIILARADEGLLRELAGTTETRSPTGTVRYVPPDVGQDHASDALRAVQSGLLRISRIRATAQQTVQLQELGWLQLGPAAPGRYVPPWELFGGDLV